MAPQARAAVDRYVAGVCAALGVTRGLFHCELRLPDDEPVLIELGARLPGMRIPDLVEAVTGTSQVRIMLAAHTGLRAADLDAFSAPTAKCAAMACFTEPGLTRYERAEGLDVLRGHEDTMDLQVYVAPREDIPPAEDFRCFLGSVVFRAESYEQAVARWHGMRNEVRFVR